eukprot:superscaffoldBa00006904_g22014
MDDLKELVLLEQFKDILPECVTTYLNEQQVKRVTEAAVLADEYTLTHKVYAGARNDGGHRENFIGRPEKVGGSDKKVFVKILRDTGALESYIVESVLPFSSVTDTGKCVLFRGMGMQLLSAPLHQLVLFSDLVQGVVAMGVWPSLPVPGVAVILGNDLAGAKVWPDVPPLPVVSSKQLVKNLADLEQNLTEVFPACSVTRAQNFRAQELEKGLNRRLWQRERPSP